MLGTTLGHYRVDALVGHGGMGEVYRALDTRLDRRVAIKVMAPHSAANLSMVERFIREARAASALNHPNIVTIHEIGQTETGAYYMVQEFVDGRTLRAMLSTPMPVTQTIQLVRQLAKALAAAHNAGIVHRDIKPENVMVRDDGYVKVLDFGLARMVTPEDETTATRADHHTAAGTLLGTTAYMSPEQAQARPADSASDIFSLGIVVYEMMTGRRPFAGDSALATLHAIVHEHPVPPARLSPDVPMELDQLALSMLSKDPLSRPQASFIDLELERLGREPSVIVPPQAAVARRTVGRDLERRVLLEACDLAAGGMRIVGVSGEPGIGKTSLVEDVLAARVEGPTRFILARGRCSERLAGAEAYLPLLEVLDNLTHASTIGRFSELMRSLAPTWYVHVAPLATESFTAQTIREDVKGASQERMKRELAVFLQEVSRARPLVVFIDDLHWADASTVDLINYLAGRADQLRLLLVVTYRGSEMLLAKHPFLQVKADLQARGVFRELSLDFLERADVDRYLALEFPQHELPGALGELIHAKTEGSPLFMVDLVRYLRDKGVIRQDNNRWVLARSLPEVERELPETVKSTISRNIERLDEVDRKLLVAASVQGHEFDAAVVSEMLGLDAADVEERLETLDRVHRLVRQVDVRELPDRVLTVRYRFVHVLYQNVLYAGLQPTRRASLSGKAAAALVGHFGNRTPTLASELALLYDIARDFTSAARQFLLAAQHAISLLGFREGAAQARRGLTAVEAVPDALARAELEIGLQVTLAACLRATEGWAAPSVEKIYMRVRDILVAAGDETHLFPVLWGLTLIQGVRSDLATWRVACEENLTRATAAGNPRFIVAASQMLGAALEFMGDTVAANALLTRQAELYVPDEHRTYVELFGLDPGMIGRQLWARTFAFLGQLDRAAALVEETIGLARRQRQPVSLVFALSIGLHIYILRREPARVLACAAEVDQLCESLGLVTEREWGRSFGAWAVGATGDVDAAITQLEASLARQEAIMSNTARSAFYWILAEQLLHKGRLDDGLRVVAEARAFSERTGEHFYDAELLTIEALLHHEQGATGPALAAAERALARAEAQQALTFELRAAMALVRIQTADPAGTAAAQSRLAVTIRRFTEGLDTPDLCDARALLPVAP